MFPAEESSDIVHNLAYLKLCNNNANLEHYLDWSLVLDIIRNL